MKKKIGIVFALFSLNVFASEINYTCTITKISDYPRNWFKQIEIQSELNILVNDYEVSFPNLPKSMFPNLKIDHYKNNDKGLMGISEDELGYILFNKSNEFIFDKVYPCSNPKSCPKDSDKEVMISGICKR